MHFPLYHHYYPLFLDYPYVTTICYPSHSSGAVKSCSFGTWKRPCFGTGAGAPRFQLGKNTALRFLEPETSTLGFRSCGAPGDFSLNARYDAILLLKNSHASLCSHVLIKWVYESSSSHFKFWYPWLYQIAMAQSCSPLCDACLSKPLR